MHKMLISIIVLHHTRNPARASRLKSRLNPFPIGKLYSQTNFPNSGGPRPPSEHWGFQGEAIIAKLLYTKMISFCAMGGGLGVQPSVGCKWC